MHHKADDSHTNMGWDYTEKALIGRSVGTEEQAFQVGVGIDDPAILFYCQGQVERYSLANVKLKHVHAWIEHNIASLGLDDAKSNITRIDWSLRFDIPEHAVLSRDADFDFSSLRSATTNLATWFANGFLVLDSVAERYDATKPRCWPHHFDVGTLLLFDKNSNGDNRSVGIGLSPGDEYYPSPYYYVSPWPSGDIAALPSLTRGGRWHTDTFVSAVLNAEGLYNSRDQFELLSAYLEESIPAAKSTLETLKVTEP